MKKIIEVFIGLIILMLWGCNTDKLSSEKAKKIIIETSKFPKDEIENFIIEYPHLDFDERKSTFESLQNEGILTYSEEFYGMGFNVHGDLTENGKQYAVSDKHAIDNYTKDIKVKLAKLVFGEITGIEEIKGDTKVHPSAKVKYTLFRKDITPFGRIAFKLQEGAFINRQAIFMKYDDGWRVIMDGIH